MRTTSFVLALAAFCTLPSLLSAQADAPPRARAFLLGGGISSPGSLGATGQPEAKFKTGPAVTFGLSYDLAPIVALRATATLGRATTTGAGWNGVSPGSSTLAGTRFARTQGALELALKAPLPSGFAPMVHAGVGVIGFNPSGTTAATGPSFTRVAGVAGLGFEYFPGHSPVGIIADASGWLYKFNRYGFNKTRVDLQYQLGVSMRF